MTVDELKKAYAKLPGKLITSRRDNFFKIEENKPVTFFVLLHPDMAQAYTHIQYGWVRPIGTHFIGKRIGCTNVAEPNTCYICEQIRILEEALSVLKQETDDLLRRNPTEGQKMLFQVQESEKQLSSIRCQEKFAMNILVKGTDIPVIFEAPKSIADPIYQMFDTAINDDGINIFDPLASTGFTVSKTGKGLATKYALLTLPRPLPIISGQDRDARIEKVFHAGFNLDEKYKLPSRTEQVTQWDAYLNPQNPGTNGVAQATQSTGPAPLSRMGTNPLQSARVVTPEEPDDIPMGTAPEEQAAEADPQEVQQPVAQTEKPTSAAVVNTLLSRLKSAGAKGHPGK